MIRRLLLTCLALTCFRPVAQSADTPADWPLAFELPSGWTAERSSISHDRFELKYENKPMTFWFQVENKTESMNDIRLELERNVEQLIQVLKEQGKVEPPDQVNYLKISGAHYNGMASEMKMETLGDYVNANIIVTDGRQSVSGHFQGKEHQWREVQRMFEEMKPAAWNDPDNASTIITEKTGPNENRAVLFERESESGKSYHLIVVKGDADPLLASGNVVVVDRPGIEFNWEGRKLDVSLPDRAQVYWKEKHVPYGLSVRYEGEQPSSASSRTPSTKILRFDLPEGWSRTAVGSSERITNENEDESSSLMFMGLGSIGGKRVIGSEANARLHLEHYAARFSSGIKEVLPDAIISEAEFEKFRGRYFYGEALVFENVHTPATEPHLHGMFFLTNGDIIEIGQYNGSPKQWRVAKEILESARLRPISLE